MEQWGRYFSFSRSNTKRSQFSVVSDARFDRRTSEPTENTLSTAAELETKVLYLLNTWIHASRCKEGKQFGVTFSLVRSTHSSSDLATTAGRFSDCFAAALPMLKFAKFAEFAKLFAECPVLL